MRDYEAKSPPQPTRTTARDVDAGKLDYLVDSIHRELRDLERNQDESAYKLSLLMEFDAQTIKEREELLKEGIEIAGASSDTLYGRLAIILIQLKKHSISAYTMRRHLDEMVHHRPEVEPEKGSTSTANYPG